MTTIVKGNRNLSIEEAVNKYLKICNLLFALLTTINSIDAQ